jgi:dTDP-4-amino-4,6-dideoxygalactose transaminase
LIGGNFRLDAIQAAVLNVKLDFLADWTRRRQENAARYTELFLATDMIRRGLIQLPRSVYQDSGAQNYHIYNQFALRVQTRDKLREYLKSQQIETEIYYPVPFHQQECFRNLGYSPGDFTESELAAAETLALPNYPELSPAAQADVVKSINDYFSARTASD